ncbi:MAG: hypothetical protein HKO94_07500, partial [Flavobacteriaceae bacterium]|nr:hypothetical protein [Flavobacteriaceae bacterium]
SCSSNDNNTTPVQDPVIGIWKPNRTVTVLNDGTENSKMATPCELNNRLTFGADGSFFMTNFPEGPDPDCEELVGNLYQSGSWERMSSTVYVIELVCMMPDCPNEYEVPDEVTFPDGNTMRIKEIDEDANDEIAYFYYYFDRVE